MLIIKDNYVNNYNNNNNNNKNDNNNIIMIILIIIIIKYFNLPFLPHIFFKRVPRLRLHRPTEYLNIKYISTEYLNIKYLNQRNI